MAIAHTWGAVIAAGARDDLRRAIMERKFTLGQVVSTPGALDAPARAGQDAWEYLAEDQRITVQGERRFRGTENPSEVTVLLVEHLLHFSLTTGCVAQSSQWWTAIFLLVYDRPQWKWALVGPSLMTAIVLVSWFASAVLMPFGRLSLALPTRRNSSRSLASCR